MTTDNSMADAIELPPGVTMQQTVGKVTGTTLYKVAGFDMPWSDTEREALRVYTTLKNAYESGYFSGGAKKQQPKPASATERVVPTNTVQETDNVQQ